MQFGLASGHVPPTASKMPLSPDNVPMASLPEKLSGIHPFETLTPDLVLDALDTVGLRGDANQLAALARTYRVAYTVKQGPPYEVTHSNAVFFFDRGGKARLVTTDTSDAAAMADDVKRLLN